MPGPLADIIVAAVLNVGGAAAGWRLHRWLRKHAPDKHAPRAAREFLSHLQVLADTMASDVGQHSTRVAAINRELSGADAREPEAVVSAVTKLIQANRQMQGQLSTVEVKLREQSQLIEQRAAEARTDALTGLANRRALDDELARRIADFAAQGRPCALLMSDIDHFKRFNDEQGHLTGDEVLRGTARVLRAAARPSDVVARYGGEEFVIVMPDATVADAAAAVEGARQAVAAARFRSAAEELHVTLSFGAAELLRGESAAAWLSRSDAALYAAKQAGRNRGFLHDGRELHAIARPEDEAAPPSAAAADAPQSDLLSRGQLCALLGQRLAEWRRQGSSPAVLLVRIDQYPELVARHGAKVGSLVLRSAVQFLGASLRTMDASAEYGAATFAILLPGAARDAATVVAERLRQAVARCVLPVNGRPLRFTVSVGGAVAAPGDAHDTILNRAEAALHAAITAGGNRTFFHAGQQIEAATTAL